MNLASCLPCAAMIAGLFALAGCQQEKAPENMAESVATASAIPDVKPGLSVSDGVLVLPAVTGRPGAAYFTIRNTGNQSATIAAIHIDGVAKAEMHETTGGSMQPLGTLDIPAGGTVAFARGGKHVMAFDIGQGLTAGASTEMTLTFAGGDKLSAPLKLEAVTGSTEATGGMSGMGHGDQH